MREPGASFVTRALAVALVASALLGLASLALTVMLATEAGVPEGLGALAPWLAGVLALCVALVAALVLAVARRGWGRVVSMATPALMTGMLAVGAILYSSNGASKDGDPLATLFFVLLFLCVAFGIATLGAGLVSLLRVHRRVGEARGSGSSEA